MPTKVIIKVTLIDGFKDVDQLVGCDEFSGDYQVSFEAQEGSIADQAMSLFMNEIPISMPENYNLYVEDENGNLIEEEGEDFQSVVGVVKQL